MTDEKMNDTKIINESKITSWYDEFHDIGAGLRLGIIEKILDKQTEFQHLEVYKTKTYGNLLTLNELVMLTQRDEFIYHEMITHIPLITHPAAEKVLIIGGGDGGTVREVAKYDSVKQIVLCEIDNEVIEASRKYFPECSISLDDPRVEIVCKDGFDFVSSYIDYWDVILIDSTDPIGPAEKLFENTFFELCKRALSSDGNICTQCESPFYHGKIIKNVRDIFGSMFKSTGIYTAHIPTYPAGFWAFMTASKRELSFETEIEKSWEKISSFQLKYLNKKLALASFALPQYLINEIK